MTWPLVLASLAVSVACSPATPAGSRPPGPGGSGGVVGGGGAGASGGEAGGAGGGGGLPTGGSGGEAPPPCPHPDNEPFCWAYDDRPWEPAPGFAFVPEVCRLSGADPGRIPPTVLAWESCGAGCEEARPVLIGMDDEIAYVEALDMVPVDGRRTPVAFVGSSFPEGPRRIGVDRLVRLDDGATLGALRTEEDRFDEYARCYVDAAHPLHVVTFAYSDPEGESSWGAATFEPEARTWRFRLPWGSWERMGQTVDVTFDGGPIPLAWDFGSIWALASPGTRDWTPIVEGTPSNDLGGFAADEAGAVWVDGDAAAAFTLRTWSPASGAAGAPIAAPGEPVALGAGSARIVVALRDGPSDDGNDHGFLPHRLFWTRRDLAGGEDRLDEPLLGGRVLRIATLVANDSFAAAMVELTPDRREVGLLIVRRSDGRQVLLAPPVWPVAGWPYGLALDDADRLYVEGENWSTSRPRADPLRRYDLARLEELGNAPAEP